MQEGDASQSMGMMMMGMSSPQPKDGYPEPDANGMYRLPIERSYRVTYVRDGGAIGSTFRLPTLATGMDAKLESQTYSDFDIVPVDGATVAVAAPFWTPMRGVLAALTLAGVAGAVMVARRRRGDAVAVAPSPWTPSRLTPLGVVTSLRRLEAERGAALGDATARTLRDEIVMLEMKYFGPNAVESVGAGVDDELRAVVSKWSKSAG